MAGLSGHQAMKVSVIRPVMATLPAPRSRSHRGDGNRKSVTFRLIPAGCPNIRSDPQPIHQQQNVSATLRCDGGQGHKRHDELSAAPCFLALMHVNFRGWNASYAASRSWSAPRGPRPREATCRFSIPPATWLKRRPRRPGPADGRAGVAWPPCWGPWPHGLWPCPPWPSRRPPRPAARPRRAKRRRACCPHRPHPSEE